MNITAHAPIDTPIDTLVDAQAYIKSRKSALSDHPSIFSEIYQEDVNIAIWQRMLSTEVEACAQKIINNNSFYQKTFVTTPAETISNLIEADSTLQNSQVLCQDIAELVDMFCLLNGLNQVGLRFTMLDQAMCPRFHVDKVPCRLVCTYYGVATEWLPHDKADRSKLGKGNNGLVDEESGIYQTQNDINQLNTGEVAMLKGELWRGNGNAGLIHRSPQVPSESKRLLLTLDFNN
jgi:hypothetical protein